VISGSQFSSNHAVNSVRTVSVVSVLSVAVLMVGFWHGHEPRDTAGRDPPVRP